MNKITILVVFALALCLISPSGLEAQDPFTYYSYPNLPIPPEGNPGIWDTLDFPNDVIIEDANFYVGITTVYTLADQLVIELLSPWGTEVTLHYRNRNRILPLWFDTQSEEDGPGDLDDFIGYSAQGEWVMHVYNYSGAYPFFWDSWAIEVHGDAVGIKDENLPLVTGLDNNYPNPFNSSTIVHFSLAEESEIDLVIYDIAGRIVEKLIAGKLTSGRHQVKWNGKNVAGEDVASGIYFCRMRVNSEKEDKTFIEELTLLR